MGRLSKMTAFGKFENHPIFNTLFAFAIAGWAVLQNPVYALSLFPWYVWFLLAVLTILYPLTWLKPFLPYEHKFWQSPLWLTSVLVGFVCLICYRTVSVFFSTSWAIVLPPSYGMSHVLCPELWILMSALGLAFIGAIGISRAVTVMRDGTQQKLAS